MIYLNLLFVFICIVFIHEFGHYLFARIFKAEVTDFSIGFGKPLLQFKDKNNTVWKISPIPLGGYVKIKGLDSVFQKNQNQEPGSFQSLKLYQKIFILLAGSFFNIFSAWIALFSIFFFFGIASFAPIIGKVLENSSACLFNEISLTNNLSIISINSDTSKISIEVEADNYNQLEELVKLMSTLNVDLSIGSSRRLNDLLIGELNVRFL